MARSLPVYTCFSYQDWVRKAIWSAKISDSRFYQILAKRLMEAFAAKMNLSSFDAVIPITASAWSRLRLRPHLAGMFAEQLSKSYNLPLWEVKHPDFFAWQKQSLRSKKVRLKARSDSASSRNLKVQLFQSKVKPGRVLLIDDVVTTGRTLERFANAYPQLECEALCFASAKRDRNSDEQSK